MAGPITQKSAWYRLKASSSDVTNKIHCLYCFITSYGKVMKICRLRSVILENWTNQKMKLQTCRCSPSNIVFCYMFAAFIQGWASQKTGTVAKWCLSLHFAAESHRELPDSLSLIHRVHTPPLMLPSYFSNPCICRNFAAWQADLERQRLPIGQVMRVTPTGGDIHYEVQPPKGWTAEVLGCTIPLMWLKPVKTIINHPQVITIFTGVINHQKLGGLLVF